MRFKRAYEMFMDVERLWRRYKYWKNFKYVKALGMIEKENHAIVQEWPYRVNTSQDFDRIEHDFEDIKHDFELRWKRAGGGERFVEWKRMPGETFLEITNGTFPGIEAVIADPRLVFGDNLTRHKKVCKVCCCDCAEAKEERSDSLKYWEHRSTKIGLDPRMDNIPNELSKTTVNELLAKLELYCETGLIEGEVISVE
jgi:hypothetical protein